VECPGRQEGQANLRIRAGAMRGAALVTRDMFDGGCSPILITHALTYVVYSVATSIPEP